MEPETTLTNPERGCLVWSFLYDHHPIISMTTAISCTAHQRLQIVLKGCSTQPIQNISSQTYKRTVSKAKNSLNEFELF